MSEWLIKELLIQVLLLSWLNLSTLVVFTCSCPRSGLTLSQSRLSSANNLCSCTFWLNSNLSRTLCTSPGPPVPECSDTPEPRYRDPNFTMLSTRFTRGLPFSYWKYVKHDILRKNLTCWKSGMSQPRYRDSQALPCCPRGLQNTYLSPRGNTSNTQFMR